MQKQSKQIRKQTTKRNPRKVKIHHRNRNNRKVIKTAEEKKKDNNRTYAAMRKMKKGKKRKMQVRKEVNPNTNPQPKAKKTISATNKSSSKTPSKTKIKASKKEKLIKLRKGQDKRYQNLTISFDSSAYLYALDKKQTKFREGATSLSLMENVIIKANRLNISKEHQTELCLILKNKAILFEFKRQLASVSKSDQVVSRSSVITALMNKVGRIRNNNFLSSADKRELLTINMEEHIKLCVEETIRERVFLNRLILKKEQNLNNRIVLLKRAAPECDNILIWGVGQIELHFENLSPLKDDFITVAKAKEIVALKSFESYKTFGPTNEPLAPKVQSNRIEFKTKLLLSDDMTKSLSALGARDFTWNDEYMIREVKNKKEEFLKNLEENIL